MTITASPVDATALLSPVEFRKRLADLGVPLFACRPGNGTREVIHPPRWSELTANHNLARVGDLPAHAIVCAVLGEHLAVIDVDTKNGANTEHARTWLADLGVPELAYVATPSGGAHLYVPGHADLPTVHASAERDGLDGLPGVEILSHGTNVFLPGSVRPKYAPAAYQLLTAELEQDGDSLALVDWVAKHRAPRPGAADAGPTAPRWDGAPPTNREQAYLDALLLGVADDLATTSVGRNNALNGAAYRLGRFIAGAGLDETTATDALLGACRHNGLMTDDGEQQCRATIASGYRAGAAKPAAAPQPPDRLANAQVTIGSEPVRDTGESEQSRHSPQGRSTSGEQHSGQVRMAYRLAQAYADQLLHVHGIGWHYWDGARWVEDDQGRAPRAVLHILTEALAESVDNKTLRSDVTRCESGSGIQGVLNVASALVEFAATVKDLDADPWLINCANGTLDLRTRQLRPHDPADRLTKITTGAYDPNAPSGEWQTFLRTVLPDNDERAYLQRVIGQAVHGAVREHLFPVLIGTGANGKGTCYGAICHALGRYATIINPELLMARERGGIGGPELMTLLGARLVIGSETEEGRKLDEAVMKRLTGGDELTARRLYRDPVSWQPTHQLLYVTNNLPVVRGNDLAVWRRMRVIPFDVTVPPDQRDPELPDRLRLHADAILTWAIAGYFDYQDNGGMREPESVLRATNAYQADSDAVARFIKDACHVASTAYATTRELHQAWQRWATDDGSAHISERQFAKELDRLGYQGKRTRLGITRAGLMPVETAEFREG